MSDRNYVQAGDFFKLDGNYKAAIKAYTKAGEYGRAAELYEQLGQIKKANKLLQKNGRPKDLAEFHQRNNNQEEAIRIYLNNDMAYEAAQLLEDQGDFERAAMLFDQLGFHEKAGILYGKSKNFEKAIEKFEKVVEEMERAGGLGSRNKIDQYRGWIANLHIGAKHFVTAGRLFEELNQKEKAARCYMKGGDTVRAARILRDMGQINQAKELLTQSPSLDSRILLGEIALQQGRFEEAATLLKDSGKHEALIKAFEGMGRFREAAFHQEKAGDTKGAAANYNKAKEYQRAALLFEECGMFEEAAGCFEKLSKYGHAAKLYHMAKNRFKAGFCLFKINRMEDALQQLQLIETAHKDYPEARKIMAEAFFKMGDFSVAKKMLDEIVTDMVMDDENLPYFYLLARCMEELGDFSSSRKYYERILARKVGFADVRNRLKMLQTNLGHSQDLTFRPKEDFSPQDLTTGDLIADRFKITSTIGKGGMGYIFKVRDLSLDRDIALKMLIHERGNFEELKAELVTARELTHPYIIKVFDIGEWYNIGYFTMEYVEGVPLKQYIHNSNQDTLETKLKLLVKICHGLHAAHEQNVVHRDIKPQNILIDRNFNPKILDFGIARKVTNRKEASISGSPKYMAPEQIQNTFTDVRTDIYALGIIMFYTFTLKEPFVARTPQEIMYMHLERSLPDPLSVNPNLPYWLCDIIKKCCMKNPDLRFNNMLELIEEFKMNMLDEAI